MSKRSSPRLFCRTTSESEEIDLSREEMDFSILIVYKGSRGGQRVRAIHHPFPQSTIRNLCKAHRDYGRDSPYFRGLLRSDLDAAVVIPADLKQLFSCLLDSTEFKLWVAAWRQQLREALPSLLRDPETAVDDNGNPLTLEHLMGEGRWADPSDQTSDSPIKALQIAREHAVSAFFGMVPDGPVVPYYKIMQGAKESFTKFVERLTRAIEVQVTEVAPILVTSSRHEPYRLRLTEALYLRTADWTFLSINTKEQGAWPVQGKELVIIGDCKYTPQEVEILPGVLVNNPGDLVLWLRCTHPPTFIPKGQVIAQIIPTRGPNNTPVACPVQAITEERPRVDCEFRVGGETINITGLLDTGADVTVVPAQDWPSHWALQDVAGHVQGVGGLQLARQSRSIVQIKGPKGQLANMRPFVLDYKEPLLGRDLMSQWGVKIDIPDPSVEISAASIDERPTKKLNWLTNKPVWVEQWPLSKPKLKALEELVKEQLAKGHIVETDSPWNSPVFVIQKPGKDKWRLLQDLRQINNVIEDMGSLQPGMPSPTMLPQNWQLAVIDIKDCFFQIPLHPDDAPRFAFSVPTINREAPRRRYHWRVLPQGMKNSPVICQWYVASLLSPVRAAVGQAIIYHYMDDVLVCAPNDDMLSHVLGLTVDALVAAGFELQEEKVQRMPPWKYLGLEIGRRTIVPKNWQFEQKSHKSVLTWKDPQTQQWEADIAEVEGSPQVAELAAVVRAFERFPEPFNLVTDSAYVAGVVSRAEQVILQEVSNIALYDLLSKLVRLVSHREQPYFVMHTRSHTDLPGFIAEGNRKADALAAPAEMAPLPNIFMQAKLSHQLFHQNAPGLVRRFHLTREQARAIVAACPSCSQQAVPTLHAGVNPRGLRSCKLWQTDVTHFPQFGRQKYVHVSVDTFSGAVFASAHTGEKAGDAIKHLIHAFSFMGIPRELKTDNGPAYKSRELRSFLQQWGVEHKTGIPHSPTGQAMVERTHGTIKRVLHQQQRVLKTESPSVRLARALFTINFLNCSYEGLNPPIVRHFGASSLFGVKERPQVMVRDPGSGGTEGPHDLVTWGRGYACVSTPTGPKWIPAKWVRPYVPKSPGSGKINSPQVTVAAWRRKKKTSNEES
ncbi:hypothetical protein DUI87_13577 [Hirundo rustica rustica]|uniref:Uncharacterized protein n=1 Tax=Hirundo rustica rustica TaxID=333673 RepID=A0A3M0KFC3_HIRRU|nr:hypothetical protein DUI87_13577 [Hirundo rustica rustica]